MLKKDATNESKAKKQVPPIPAKEPMRVVDFVEVVECLDAELKKKVSDLNNELESARKKLERAEAIAHQTLDSPVKLLDRRLEKAITFIRYVANMDQAFYRKPNDWHIGLQMTARAQEWMANDDRLRQKRTTGTKD